MTATDELRRLLDERGVEWRAGEIMTFTDGADYMPTEIDKLNVSLFDLTPTQAVEATLGRGTCHCTTPDDAWCFSCSACGKNFPRSDLHMAHNHGAINYCPNCGAKVVGA